MEPNKLRMHTSAVYTIRIVGTLDDTWSGRLGGLAISSSRDKDRAPVTMLSGSLTDQAALFGVLNTLYDMLFPLLSVECTSDA